ncbi:hypothetical protein V5O48_018716 [Marasmius crinis-equi]|uniref:SH3 domain-containing protein n=1 Tax=Marasmius crinis-equi TaxID=585013 RepID=A0ABR3EKD3_9AGAR
MSRRASAALSRSPSSKDKEKRGSLLGVGLAFTAMRSSEDAVTPFGSPSGKILSSTAAVSDDASGTGDSYRSPIQIRDFAYPADDQRHLGMGDEVPKPNRVRLLNRRLLGEDGWRRWRKEERKKRKQRARARESIGSIGSLSSRCSEDDWEENATDANSDDETEDDDNNGWGGLVGFKLGMGRFSWGLQNGGSSASKATTSSSDSPSNSNSASGFPSQTDLDRNFADSSESSDTEDDDDGAGSGQYYSANASPMPVEEDLEGEEEELYPGLYKALYAFEPEGTAEMALHEDQLVHVVGRGGGVGWAVVIVDGVDKHGNYIDVPDDEEGKKKHALVPESYLEAVKFDVDADADGQT